MRGERFGAGAAQQQSAQKLNSEHADLPSAVTLRLRVPNDMWAATWGTRFNTPEYNHHQVALSRSILFGKTKDFALYLIFEELKSLKN